MPRNERTLEILRSLARRPANHDGIKAAFQELLIEEKVLLVQGSGFNWPATDHFRVVFLPNIDDLSEAISRIGRFLESYRKRHGT